MERGNEKAGFLRGQVPGLRIRHCTAASMEKIARFQSVINEEGQTFRARNVISGTWYRVEPTLGEPFLMEVKGRVAWALDRLRDAGAKGCTPIAEPGPRWSAYVHELRQLGVEIETIREPHGAPFAGHHGRYVLRSTVRRVAR